MILLVNSIRPIYASIGGGCGPTQLLVASQLGCCFFGTTSGDQSVSHSLTPWSKTAYLSCHSIMLETQKQLLKKNLK